MNLSHFMRQREKKRLEEAERKRIAEIRKPKINQKSVKLARHRQYMYIMKHNFTFT